MAYKYEPVLATVTFPSFTKLSHRLVISSPIMDRCPVEIIHEICSLACAGDGSAGRVLSLVSKPIRDIAEPVRLRSVVLHSVRQIILFSSFLESRPGHLRRVHNLFLSVTRSSRWVQEVPPEDGNEADSDVSDLRYTENPDWRRLSQTTTRVISGILEMVSPRLHLLTLVLTSTPDLGEDEEFAIQLPSFPNSMPSLTELTIYTSFGTYCLDDSDDEEPSIDSDFFKKIKGARYLKRLYIASDHLFLDSTEHSFPTRLSHTFPHLTHLGLSGVQPHGIDFLQDLFDLIRWDRDLSVIPKIADSALSTIYMLADPTRFGGLALLPIEFAAPLEHAPRFSTNIQKIFITLCKSSRRCLSSTTYPYGIFKHRLGLLANVDRQLGHERLVVCERGRDVWPEDFELQQYGKLYDWWMDRVEGGDGCWSIETPIVTTGAEPQEHTSAQDVQPHE